IGEPADAGEPEPETSGRGEAEGAEGPGRSTAPRTLVGLMQEVQTLRRTGVRPSRMRMRWMFGFQRRGLRLWEKLTFMPKPGCLPQISQTAAMEMGRAS